MRFMFVTASNMALLFTQQVNNPQVNKKVGTLMNRALTDSTLLQAHTGREK